MVELIWDGKYDADGRRVVPSRIALPFQTVETVNESAQQRESQSDASHRVHHPAMSEAGASPRDPSANLPGGASR